MPTYTYKCKTNGHIFEKRQKFSDDPLTECIECGEPVRKVIRNVGVVFKGKGFYVTDNRSKNSAAPTSGSKGDSDSSSTASDSSGTEAAKPSAESKSAATPAKATATDT